MLDICTHFINKLKNLLFVHPSCMKRRLELIEEENDESTYSCEILPPELWPCILVYLRLWERYRYAAVCTAWSKPRGLIDQSVKSIYPKDHLIEPVDLARFVNLIRLKTGYDEFVPKAIKGHAFNNLQSLSLSIARLGIEEIIEINSLRQLTCLELTVSILHGTNEISLSLSELSYLRIVYLGRGGAGGPPYISESTLLSSTRLSELHLQDVRVDNEILVKTTPCLERLTFYQNHDTSNRGVISRLTNLRALLTNDGCSEKGMFIDLTGLTELVIINNHVTCDQDITHLTSLRKLDLCGNVTITDKVLTSFTLLTSLCLAYPMSIRNGLVSTGYLRNNLILLTNLKKLVYLSGPGRLMLTDALCNLTQIRSLSIYGDHDTSFGSTLACLTKLERLSLSSLTYVNLKTLPVSLRKLDLRYCSCWERLVHLGPRLTNFTDLMVRAICHPLPFTFSVYLNDFSSLPFLKRIHYSYSAVLKRHTIPNLPDSVELVSR